MDFTRDDITTRTGIKKGRGVENFIPAGQYKLNVASRRVISDDERDTTREEYMNSFYIVDKVKSRMMTLKTLDQDQDGACTVASLFNLMHVNDKDHLHPWRGRGARRRAMTWNQIKALTVGGHGVYFGYKVFNQITKKLENQRDPEDYQEMLQVGSTIPVISNVLADPQFRYVPIRSRKLREAYINRDIVSDGNDFVNQIGAFIEGLLDRGIPVGMSSNGHARVAVGYNDTEMLYLDSWGDNYAVEQEIQSGGKGEQVQDKFKAGFSTFNKYVMYGDVRDIVYFDTSIEQQMKQLSVSAGESKHSESGGSRVRKLSPRRSTRKSTRRSTRSTRSKRNGLSTELGQPRLW